MKKVSILLGAIMISGSLSAQIEEVSAEQYAPKKEVVTKAPIDYLLKVQYPANLLEAPYNLIGYQLYCTRNQTQKGYPIVAITLTPDNVIGIKRLQKGAYYNVSNIVCSRKELLELQTRFLDSKNYSGDTIQYLDRGKVKVYSLAKAKKVDVPALLKTSGLRINDDYVEALYELTDAEGLKYYIGCDKEWASCGGGWDIVRHPIQLNNGFIIAAGPSIGDFISVNTYNYLKAKYEKKDVVAPGYYDPCAYGPCDKGMIMADKHIIHVEKIGVENGTIVCALKDPNYNEVQLRAYKGGKEYVPTRHKNDTLYGLFVEGYWCSLAFRTDADSILNKWYHEELVKEEQVRAERAKKKAEYVKKYGEQYAQYIIDNKVCVGMTKAMCQEAMGRPNNVTRNSSALGIVEVWTYSTWYPLVPITVVTLLDNKVTAVDEYKDNYPF